jgi:multidrug efflux pump subunit AcrA (membrane-fusion protein)
MTDLTKRRLSIVGAGIVLLVGFMGYKSLSQQKEEAPRKPPVVSVKQAQVMKAQQETIATTLDVQGQLAAFDKVELYAEVGGMVQNTGRPFKVGTYFPKGSPLIKIDDSETRLALLAQKSTLLNAIAQAMPDLKIDYSENFSVWEAYLNNFDVEEMIKPLPEPKNDQEKRFIATRNLYTQYYNIKSQEERLSKYTLYAPFSGVLTDASINPGSVIRTGQKLGELMATGNYELIATVPMSDLNYIKVGNSVKLTSEDIDGEWQGTVKRIGDQIDPGSQTVQVFIGVNGKELREGMYLRGDVVARSVSEAIRIPRNLLVDQTQVFTIQDSILRLHNIKLVKVEPEMVILQGVPNGTPLLAKPIPGAFDGMKVEPLPAPE